MKRTEFLKKAAAGSVAAGMAPAVEDAKRSNAARVNGPVDFNHLPQQ